MALSVKITESLQGLESLREPWNRLLENSAADSVFLTWEWLCAWAETNLGDSRRLFLLTFHDGSELVGVAPWCLRPRRILGLVADQLEFLGGPEGGSDYLDVFALKGREKDVADRLAEFLWQEAPGAWGVCSWQDIPANSPFLMHFVTRIQALGKHLEMQPGAYCPCLSLPDTTETFFSRLSPSRRKRFNYDWRVLNRESGIRHVTYGQDQLAPSLLDSFFELYYRDRRDDANMRVFLDRYLSRKPGDAVQLDCLRSGETIIAGLLHLKHRDTRSLYLMATDKTYNPKISAGNVLVGLSIEEAIKSRQSTYDFLKGQEAYKFSWANGVRSTLHVRFYHRRLAPLLLLAGASFRNLCKCAVR